MALILNLEENKAIVLSIDIVKINETLLNDENIGSLEDGQTFIMINTLHTILSNLECSIVCKPNYEEGGTTVVLGLPKEVIAIQRKNKNLPHLNSNSSSGK